MSSNFSNFEVLEHLPTGICIIDKNYEIIFWNNTLETWTNNLFKNIIGKDLRSFYPIFEDKKYSSRIKEIFKGGPPIIFSSQIHKFLFSAKTQNNRQRIQHIIVSAIPSEIEKEFYAIFSVEDVTEITHRTIEYRKLKIEAEEKAREISVLNTQLTIQAEHLKELNLQKDKFFSIISHDLKSPFNGFLGLLKMLKESFGEFSNEEIFEMIEMMYNSANSVWELLETLLDWARSQTGKMPFEPDDNNISFLLKNQLRLFKTVADNKGINLIGEGADTNLMAYFDYKMIETVARNLISNSLKFTNHGGTIIIKIEKINDMIIFSVIDNGVGISEKNLAKLFRLDTQVTTLGTLEEKGTGLGLILCKDFVEKNGGKLWVESKIGEGTTFSFSLKTFSN